MTTFTLIATLDAAVPGWTEGPGGMLVNPKSGGAIIDKNFSGLGWFVILNDNPTVDLEGYDTREDAVEAYFQAVCI